MNAVDRTYTPLPERGSLIGLDLSLTSTGFHKLAADGRILDSGAITADKSTGMERLDLILARISNLVREGDFVVLEDNAFRALGRARSGLAELSGIVKFWLWRRQIRYLLIAPTMLKKFILGVGRGDKALIVREVFKAYGLNAGTDDEADASVLAHIGMCIIGAEEPRNRQQREVLANLTAEKRPPRRPICT